MAEYENLAALRSDLNTDDRGRMLDAADTVRDAGFSIDDVLSDDPPVDALREAGVIPPEDTAMTAREQRERIIELLEQMVGGS